MADAALGPPSSQLPSAALMHELEHPPGGVAGGAGGEGGQGGKGGEEGGGRWGGSGGAGGDEGGGHDGGGDAGGGGEKGGGEWLRGLQSVQSLPYAQSPHSEPGPPSSQSPSNRYEHVAGLSSHN